VSHTSCILYFFLASRRHLRIDPKYPSTDPSPKLAKALSRIVSALNPYCSFCDNTPIRENIRRPKIRNDRERAVVKDLPEREIRCHSNCSQLSNDIGRPAGLSGFDIKGSSGPSYGGLWESWCIDNILKRVCIIDVLESTRV